MQVVVGDDDKSGHERSEGSVAGRVGGGGYRRQSAAVEVTGGEHVARLVERHRLDAVRPTTSQLQRRLQRLHACTPTSIHTVN